jgi:hypothetical protein
MVIYFFKRSNCISPQYWSSGSMYAGVRPCNNVQMQGDGNFVLYSKANGIATWATGTNGNNGATLHMQDDGNLVVYTSGNQPIWASWTVLNPQLLSPCPGLPGNQTTFSCIFSKNLCSYVFLFNLI